MDKSSSEADSLKSIFLETSGDDLKFLQAISKALTDKSFFDNFISNEPVVIETLAQLHNEGVINVIKSYGSLDNTVGIGINFSLTRGILEKLLPRLEAPVLEVMECIIHLVKAAGQDLAAGTIINSFVDFCDIKSIRSDEALKLIENSDNKFTELLIPTLVSGSRWDIDRYFDKTLHLLIHETIEIRAKAIFALGKLTIHRKLKLKLNSIIKLFIAWIYLSAQKQMIIC